MRQGVRHRGAACAARGARTRARATWPGRWAGSTHDARNRERPRARRGGGGRGAIPVRFDARDHAAPAFGSFRRRSRSGVETAHAAHQTRSPIGVGDHLRPLARRFEVVPSHAGTAGAGPLILGAVEERGCDLVVMGAYGRSWLHEWVLGGATRHVPRNARLPVLPAN